MSTSEPGKSAGRLRSLDAYRGFVMLAMASGGLGLPAVAAQHAESSTWDWVAFQFEHVAWGGCSFWDMIQPSFMFMVGVALPFSHAARSAKGQSWGSQFAHAVWRSLVLVALGVFLSSNWSDHTEFTFVNVLTQIGLGYWFVFLLLGRPPGVQFGVALAILVGYWALFALYPLPGTDFHPGSVGIPDDWKPLEGFAAHWEKNANAASAFDLWFLNLFPRPEFFRFNEGGYATLNFIPSIATMTFGVLAGEWLRAHRSRADKVFGLLIAGAVCLAIGTVLDGHLCPVVKRIWTPSWVIYSTAWTCWMLAGFYLVIDVAGYQRWAFPLVVVGMNSIAMYVMAQLLKPWIRKTLQIHVGTLNGWLRDRFGLPLSPDIFGGPYGPIIEALSVLGVLWLVCLWMYRRKIFLKV